MGEGLRRGEGGGTKYRSINSGPDVSVLDTEYIYHTS